MATALSNEIVHWAHGHLGQQIGSGECWDLVDRALRHAGARSSTTTGKNDDYVWGTRITLEQVVPGDLLQFRDFIVTDGGQIRAATVTTTTTVTVSGKVWAYHPETK